MKKINKNTIKKIIRKHGKWEGWIGFSEKTIHAYMVSLFTLDDLAREIRYYEYHKGLTAYCWEIE